jgi:hypothetical protein
MFFFTHQHIPASILILSVAVIFSACEDTSEITLNNELIFPEAHEIKVPSYVYQSVNGDIMIHGDEAYNGNTVDTVNSEPVIRWDSVQTGLIVAAIFDGFGIQDWKLAETDRWYLKKGKASRTVYWIIFPSRFLCQLYTSIFGEFGAGISQESE